MKYSKLKEAWEKEEKKAFEGWDFSYIENRWEAEELPWDYKGILIKYLNSNYKLLDMGTGGGEFLLSLKHPYKNTSVTEMWEPNVELCKKRLTPLGIEVKQVFNDSDLPFKDEYFHMIINRQASFDIKEVKRILKPNGIFITQQVGGKNNEVLSKVLIKNFKPLFSENTLENNLKKFKENSFEILYAKEFFPHLRFKDIGALVYFAKIIEWEFPSFSVDSCFEELCKLQEELNVKGYIDSLEHRFIIVCRKQK
ncbi:class I SAM-dependent methyltransferase [Clostridium sp. YIM B02555]|uniref:class I SAM-dependent methyltransferase n=1 Tax=Clostridium sp. YIM B02555 TaxID=2911968 RepID=UPI001EEDB12F|nr:class I SAM-dependent methyltransferase [Clostridium sp. YIM B02555]